MRRGRGGRPFRSHAPGTWGRSSRPAAARPPPGRWRRARLRREGRRLGRGGRQARRAWQRGSESTAPRGTRSCTRRTHGNPSPLAGRWQSHRPCHAWPATEGARAGGRASESSEWRSGLRRGQWGSPRCRPTSSNSAISSVVGGGASCIDSAAAPKMKSASTLFTPTIFESIATLDLQRHPLIWTTLAAARRARKPSGLELDIDH